MADSLNRGIFVDQHDAWNPFNQAGSPIFSGITFKQSKFKEQSR